jgi:hypothetical protein
MEVYLSSLYPQRMHKFKSSAGGNGLKMSIGTGLKMKPSMFSFSEPEPSWKPACVLNTEKENVPAQCLSKSMLQEAPAKYMILHTSTQKRMFNDRWLRFEVHIETACCNK